MRSVWTRSRSAPRATAQSGRSRPRPARCAAARPGHKRGRRRPVRRNRSVLRAAARSDRKHGHPVRSGRKRSRPCAPVRSVHSPRARRSCFAPRAPARSVHSPHARQSRFALRASAQSGRNPHVRRSRFAPCASARSGRSRHARHALVALCGTPARPRRTPPGLRTRRIRFARRPRGAAGRCADVRCVLSRPRAAPLPSRHRCIARQVLFIIPPFVPMFNRTFAHKVSIFPTAGKIYKSFSRLRRAAQWGTIQL